MESFVAVAGEVITDLVPAEGRCLPGRPGGSPANVAVGLARLDVPARMLARLSDDVLGRRLRAHLAGNGVDLSYAVAAPEPSSLAIVALQADGSGGVRLPGGRHGRLAVDRRRADVGAGRRVALHVGSLGLTTPPGGAVLRRLAARATGTRRCPSTRTCGRC